MEAIRTRLDTSSDDYRQNHAAMGALLDEVRAAEAVALLGGGEKYIARHRERGKLLVRERVDLLVDRAGWFLELSPLAGWGTSDPVSGNLVTGVGVVAGVECVIIANDPTM